MHDSNYVNGCIGHLMSKPIFCYVATYVYNHSLIRMRCVGSIIRKRHFLCVLSSRIVREQEMFNRWDHNGTEDQNTRRLYLTASTRIVCQVYDTFLNN